jgi:hypothetical protein
VSKIIAFLVITTSFIADNLLAEFESPRIFPTSTDVWFQISSVNELKYRIADGPVGKAFENFFASPQGKRSLENLRFDDFRSLEWSDLTIAELITIPQKEFAYGQFSENGSRKWCVFIDAADETIGLEIFCLNLDKKLVSMGCERQDRKIGECIVSAWHLDGKCIVSYAQRGSQFLYSNSASMLSEMAIRWINGINDGLSSDVKFGSSFKSLNLEKRVGINLFLRHGNILQPNSDLRKSLNRQIPYGLYPLIESYGESSFFSIWFPAKPSDVEMEFHAQLNLRDGVDLVKQPAKAVFPEQVPFGSVDVLSYSVLAGDFWTANAFSWKLTANEGQQKEMEEIANILKVPVDEVLGLRESRFFFPCISECALPEEGRAVIYNLRKGEKIRQRLLDSRTFADGPFSSTRKVDTRDGVYYVMENLEPEIPNNVKLLDVSFNIPNRVYGIRDDYYIESNSERFLGELPILPKETLSDTASFLRVKDKLLARSDSKSFAIQYFDFPRIIQTSGLKIRRSDLNAVAKRIGFDFFDNWFPATAEFFGPVGCVVKKNQNGIRVEYFLLDK